MGLCPIIRLDEHDNVVVARHDIAAGVKIPEEGITTRMEVPSGYKVAARFIKKGEAVKKLSLIHI